MERSETIGTQIQSIHHQLRAEFPEVERVAVVLYDEKTDTLKTFVHSTDGASPLEQYDAHFGDVPSLGELASTGRTRVVEDLRVFDQSTHVHSLRLLERGYRSSYTAPFYDNGELRGFLFFDSKLQGYFQRSVVERLQLFARLVSLVVTNSLIRARCLRAAVRVAADVSQYRDPETGAHLDRMCRYARLIAQQIAPASGLSDEFVEFLFLFSPLHDIGKVAIPDRILLKPGNLTIEEYEVMKMHTTKGGEIIDRILNDLGLSLLPHVQLLRNLALYHHEMVDGSGYPSGLRADQIPIEARIVTVADVYDALTSRRPYKLAWSREDAFAYLNERSGTKFDSSCCEALATRVEQAEDVRHRFQDEETCGFQSREGYTLDL